MHNAAVSLVLLGSACALWPGTSLAQQRRPVPPATACNSADESCRDDCTMDYGASIQTRQKLGLCLEKCETTHHDCTERWTEMHRNELDPANFEPEKVPPPRLDEGRTRAGAPDAPDGLNPPGGSNLPGADPLNPPDATDSLNPPDVRDAEPPPSLKPEPEPAELPAYPADDDVKLPSDEQLRGPPASGEKKSHSGEEDEASASASSPPPPAKGAAVPKVREEVPAPKRDDGLPPEPEDDISDWDPDGE